MRIADVRELTALEREDTRINYIVTLVEVRILLVLVEVGDRELASMAMICSSEPLNSTGTLSTIADLEETAIGGYAGTFDLSVVHEINRVRNAVIPTHMSIHVSLLIDSLASALILLLLTLFDGRDSLLSQKHVLRIEVEVAAAYFLLINRKAQTTLILYWNLAFVYADLFPKVEEAVGFADLARCHGCRKFHVPRLDLLWQETLISSLAMRPIL